MIDRREFLQGTSAVVMAALSPTLLSAELAKLPTRLLPGSTEALPIIGLGNSRAFISGDIAASTQLLETFMSYGGGYVDVSGSSRGVVGKIIADRGAQSTTFLGNYLSAGNLVELREEVRALQQLQKEEALDLAMSRSVDDLMSRADEYRTLQEDGNVRHVGIGRPNKRFYEPMMKLMKRGVVDFVQVNYSPLETEAENEILPLAMDLGIAVVINRPFMNGSYFGIVKNHELPEWAADFDCNSWAQFSLKFIVSHPAVNCVLTETANPKHVIDNLGGGIGRQPDATTRAQMVRHLRGIAG